MGPCVHMNSVLQHRRLRLLPGVQLTGSSDVPGHNELLGEPNNSFCRQALQSTFLVVLLALATAFVRLFEEDAARSHADLLQAPDCAFTRGG